MAWPWVALWRWLRRSPVSVEQARAQFGQQRDDLQRLFFEGASTSGKPRGLRWQAIDWETGVSFARERQTGQLAALVGITIHFEAIEGSDMEDLPAVGMPRNASAVFFYHRGRWHTTGKTLFNVNPDEAIERLKTQYERLPAD
jgi:hypothetical protein